MATIAAVTAPNGGAKGTTAAVSFDGGLTWANVSVPTLTRCQGGEFDRASDPWVSFGPDGVVHHRFRTWKEALRDAGKGAS